MVFKIITTLGFYGCVLYQLIILHNKLPQDLMVYYLLFL